MNRFNVRLLRCDSAEAVREQMAALGADPRGIAIMAPKGRFHLILVEKVPFAAASILKQELLAKGGEAALSGEIYLGGERTTHVLLMGTERALHRVVNVLRVQPLPSLQQLGGELETALRHAPARAAQSCRIGTREFAWGQRTYVMGIVNVTPDSFSGDGLLRTGASQEKAAEAAVAQALRLVEEGADIVDIGGESTRPGSVRVDADVELARVLPVIKALRKASDVPISVDTYRASVACAALDAGADLVNDIWGLQMDAEMAPLLAQRGVSVVLMHNRSKPKDAAQQERLGGRYVGVHYEDLLGDILRELRQQIDHATAAGIAPERILVDPGIGFGKTVEQNLCLLNHVDELRVLGLPILVGPSRKSFVGYVLDLPPEERLEGTLAAVVLACARGADIVRVHDVKAATRAVRMADAILRARATPPQPAS